jgi:hypothetical protein
VKRIARPAHARNPTRTAVEIISFRIESRTVSGSLEPPRSPLSPPVREACEATDWEEYAVVGVVTFLPATSRGFEGDRQRIEVYRYRERAHPVDRYENGERTYRIQRLTRPLYDRLK